MVRRVAVIGVGHSKFGRRSDATYCELAFEAVKEALEDAGVTQRDIGLSVIGSVGNRLYDMYPAPAVNEYLGFTHNGPLRVEAACATGAAAIFMAYNAIRSGCVDTAIAIGVEKMTEVDVATSTAIGGRGCYLWEFHMFGTSFTAYYALFATAHMMKYGTTEEQLAKIAVKNHYYAARNPKAHLQREITIEEALKSRVVCWPLKLYDCCPISDGAAAVILASEKRTKEFRIEDPIWVDAIGFGSDVTNHVRREDFTSIKSTRIAAEMAYKMAGVSPEDIEVAEVHDCFTIAEIMAYEDLGFCRKGEGGRMADEGQTWIGGKIPINVDGGLKAKGHPLGATGCSMVYELVRQLRNESGNRQVPLKRYIGLAHNVGMTGQYCYVIILRR
ncbi:MAG: thiolase domain-containing protein [Candidatus Nezhaarchaeota archaeon]|nr:thiolase domain-containing protein [Candidatus Nezhaarchaeota archaeon]MCX8141463.1 thiolase domain-containing protein [Candidatus Nezhaarchaeota archaeon]MDW8049729.1 thiolase domain-containing protein [Nitrososphaerota archaeon]